jgi:uncharacterized protein YpmB
MYENKKQYYIVTGKDRRKHSLQKKVPVPGKKHNDMVE